MVSELLHYSETEVTSGYTIPADNLFVKDSVFTEPGIVENMAQTVALHTGFSYFLKGEHSPTGYIGSIKKVVIRKLPEVHEKLITTVSILQEFMGVTLVKIVVINTLKEVVAHGEMKTVIANNR